MKTITFLAAALCALPLAAAAAETAPTVVDAYARSANAQAGAAFMTIHNPGPAACTLASVASTVARQTELHTHKDEGGVMKMVKVDSLTVPAGGDLTLQRGGDHVMLMGLEKPLKDGDKVAMTLDFGDCGTVPTEVTVDNKRTPAEASGQPAAMDHSAMDHGAMDHGAMDHSAMGHGAHPATPPATPPAN